MSKNKRKHEHEDKQLDEKNIQKYAKEISDHIKLELNCNDKNEVVESLEPTIETLLTKISNNNTRFSEEFDLFCQELNIKCTKNQISKDEVNIEGAIVEDDI